MIAAYTLLVTFWASLVAAAPQAINARHVDKKYIFATFSAENQQTSNEKTWLNIYSSDDGVHYDEYAMKAYSPAKPWLIRDPSIIEYLGTYYVAFTTGWYGTELGIISSTDLKNWNSHASIKLDWAGLSVQAAWAPEFFWDPNGGSLNIIVSIQGKADCTMVRGENRCTQKQFKPHIISANAGEPLKLWSAPKEIGLLTNKDSHIDMFVVHKDDDKDRPYHAFIKNEKSKVIEHWKANLIEGPYDWVGVANGKWGQMEGPAVSKTPEGKWIMYADNYHGTYLYAESDDLNSWGGMTELPNQAHNVRHGTVLKQG